MTLSKIVVSLAVVGLFGAAIADDEKHVKIDVVTEGSNHDAIRIELDSAEMGFNLHDMQEGENRSIVDKEGRTILVTREADGFSFDVDGKKISMPMLHGEHATVAMAHDGDNENIDVRVMHHAGDMTTDVMDGTMIITADPVDEATQQAIRSLLESAGHGGEAHFIDRDSARDGDHKIKVIKKVEVVSD